MVLISRSTKQVCDWQKIKTTADVTSRHVFILNKQRWHPNPIPWKECCWSVILSLIPTVGNNAACLLFACTHPSVPSPISVTEYRVCVVVTLLFNWRFVRVPRDPISNPLPNLNQSLNLNSYDTLLLSCDIMMFMLWHGWSFILHLNLQIYIFQLSVFIFFVFSIINVPIIHNYKWKIFFYKASFKEEK